MSTCQYQMDFSIFCAEDSSLPCNRLNKTKPFIKWVGGKGQLIPSLVSRLPKDFLCSINTYIEPFIGGGAFLFWVLSHCNNIKHIVINDANSDLINAYRIIRDLPDKLIEILSTIQKDYLALQNEEAKKVFYYSKREVFNLRTSSAIEQAAHLIFLNKTCFNGLYRVNAKGDFNVPCGRYANPLICDPVTIYADSEALRNVDIKNGDFSDVLQETDEHCFVYFDPPYRPLSITSSFCSYCEGGFDDKEQQRLASMCRVLASRGTRWMLSNSDPKSLCPQDTFFDDLYQGFNIQNVQANRMINANASRRGKLNELLISNY